MLGTARRIVVGRRPPTHHGAYMRGKGYLTPAEVAKEISVSYEPVLRWIKEGRIASRESPIGSGHLWVHRAELDRFKENNPVFQLKREDYVTFGEIEKLLDVGHDTPPRWAKRGLFRVEKADFGRYYRVPRSDFERFVRETSPYCLQADEVIGRIPEVQHG